MPVGNIWLNRALIGLLTSAKQNRHRPKPASSNMLSHLSRGLILAGKAIVSSCEADADASPEDLV